MRRTLRRLLVAGTFTAVAAMALTPGAAQAADSSQIWTLQSAPLIRSWDGVAFGDGLFVVVSNSNVYGDAQVITSPDGVTWTQRTPANDFTYRDVIWAANQFVAVGATGHAMTSPDGITWTAQTMSDASKNYYGVTYGANLYVAVGGSAGAISTSPDGITWTTRTSGTTANLRTVTYGNGVFVALASPTSGQSQLITSTDGMTWTPRSGVAANDWYDVSFGNGLFVAVSTDGAQRLMTSTDGITWTPRDAASVSPWRSVAFGAGTWTAVAGDANAGGGAAMNSPDGITWYSASPASTTSWRDVFYGAGIFVAVSDFGGVMSAPPATYRSGAPGLVVRQALPIGSDGTCIGVDDAAFAYGSGIYGGWQRSWQPWPNGYTGGWACARALINVAGNWRIDNSAA